MEYKKAVWHLRSEVMSILKPFEFYGQKDLIMGAVVAIIKAAEDFGLVVRGADHPILVLGSKPHNEFSGQDD
jgi:hypothetical protein